MCYVVHGWFCACLCLLFSSSFLGMCLLHVSLPQPLPILPHGDDPPVFSTCAKTSPVLLKWMRLPCILKMPSSAHISSSARMMAKPSCEVRSRLFAKEPFTKTNSRAEDRSSGMKRRPRSWFSICHLRRLFSALISSFVGSWCCAALDRSKQASGWQIESPW